MYKILLTIVLFFSALSLSAQYLGTTDWNGEEEFRLVEDKIIEDIIWLEENPFATDINDTKAISEYVLEWLEATPYISVTLDEIFTERISNSKKYKYGDKFLITYLFGKSLYMIQNPNDPNEISASVRGVEGMVRVYSELLKTDLKAYNRTLEYYQNLIANGGLEDYVRAEFKQRGIGFP